jgi:hypothetical protein
MASVIADERRRHPRVPVAWPVRLWIDEESLIGRAEDAGPHGICVAVAPTASVKLGRSCRVEILAEDVGQLTVAADVRHVGERRVGLETAPLAESLWSTAWDGAA